MSQKTIEELEFEETGVTRKERWKIMWASIIGYAMDGLDVLILSFAMAAIVSEFGLTLGEGGMIATYTLIGTVLGGYIFGIFADWWGRVHTFSSPSLFSPYSRAHAPLRTMQSIWTSCVSWQGSALAVNMALA